LDQNLENVELVIIDNASTDHTAEVIRREFPHAKVIRTHRNIGFFPALNLAIANALGEFLMTVDDDAFFQQPDALSRIVAAFRTDPTLGGVTCNIEGPREAPPTPVDRYVHTYKTGFAMLPSRVFTEWVGYYPDAFFRSGGESYVASALWDQGRPFVQLSDVSIYHAQSLQSRSSWDWSFYGTRSQILVTLMRDPWCVIPLRLMGKFLRGFQHSIRRGQFFAWAAAWSNVWLYLPYAWRLRRPVRFETYRRLKRLQRPTRCVESGQMSTQWPSPTSSRGIRSER
jgi:GT2 family glycosyltransferase